ncbi:hypothetical protein PAESOLCIP111_03794 [Paenibacillus solanacearum]|uniref:Uncharacterized protein n=1 Tax=Paenibacillus solanacearum TaxID=2048548 RepID=A0A916K623_9BACL|nr:hypothetical protein PAESOLCIP111_03794 [Paenibacillus solanacearum]
MKKNVNVSQSRRRSITLKPNDRLDIRCRNQRNQPGRTKTIVLYPGDKLVVRCHHW